jgi:AcrR family transcriptional regulator
MAKNKGSFAVQTRAMWTKQRILEAAAKEFDLHGYNGATMAAIQARAGLTKGAVYFHFASKADLAKEIFSADERRSTEAAALSGRAIQLLVNASHEYARLLIEDSVTRAGVRLAIEQGTFVDASMTAYAPWIIATTALFERARAEGDLIDSVDAAEAARMVVSSFVGVHIVSQALTERKDLHERLTEFWDAVLLGLVPPERLKTVITAAPKYRRERLSAKKSSSPN